MRRIMVLVTVALVMAVLMALSALPVMAVNWGASLLASHRERKP